MSRAEDAARRDLDMHVLRLFREAEAKRATGSRAEAFQSLARSRGVTLAEVIMAADAGELRSIVELPDCRRLPGHVALARLRALKPADSAPTISGHVALTRLRARQSAARRYE